MNEVPGGYWTIVQLFIILSTSFTITAEFPSSSFCSPTPARTILQKLLIGLPMLY